MASRLPPPTATLDARTLNRTLLARQHLLGRLPAGDPVALAEHLVGLQAQETPSPYLGVAARVEGFDAETLSTALEERRVVRLLLMRGTVHLVTPDDAAHLRPLVQPLLDRSATSVGSARAARHLSAASVVGAGLEVLDEHDPLGVAALGRLLAERFPDAPPAALADRLRYHVPLVQLPPRGRWGRPGGVVYDTLERWTGRAPEPAGAPGLAAGVVRRYLRAFGPASAADVATWSGMTGVAAVLEELADELVTYRDADGRVLVDVRGLPLADAGAPAPPRLLGRYDNVWLAHAGRDRVTDADARARWAGLNGGTANAVLVGGRLAGLWRAPRGGGVELELFEPGALAVADRVALDEEVERTAAFLEA